LVVKMAHIVTDGELLDGHSVLDIECLDRIYLNAYVPTLQSSGQVVAFMTQHLGKPIPSPALMEHIGTRFRQAMDSYASANEIPWVRSSEARADHQADRNDRHGGNAIVEDLAYSRQNGRSPVSRTSRFARPPAARNRQLAARPACGTRSRCVSSPDVRISAQSRR
jgi:hypothetical protein